MKVVFMGSPEFAVPALQMLLNSTSHEVTCVYTKEPKPFGRGHKMRKTPIHIIAEEHNIHVLTPTTLKREVINCEADIIVVAAYGMILPKSLLECTKYGCINIHPSLLPRWRGAAPIQHAILAGDNKTGVCIMQMTEGLDVGDVLSVQAIDVYESDDYKGLHDKLSKIGAGLLLEVMSDIGVITPIKQSDAGVTYASKIKKELVNWNNSTLDIARKIRALQGVDCILKDKRIKILQADYDNLAHELSPGSIINDRLHIACGSGTIMPKVLQIPGKAPVHIDDFLRGNNYLL